MGTGPSISLSPCCFLRLLCLLQNSSQCGKSWGISQENVSPQHCLLPSEVGLLGAVHLWGGHAGRQVTHTGSAPGQHRDAGSDFPCLRLLVLAAELPWELPDRGRLENSPPTASAAGVNMSGLLLL